MALSWQSSVCLMPYMLQVCKVAQLGGRHVCWAGFTADRVRPANGSNSTMTRSSMLLLYHAAEAASGNL